VLLSHPRGGITTAISEAMHNAGDGDVAAAVTSVASGAAFLRRTESGAMNLLIHRLPECRAALHESLHAVVGLSTFTTATIHQ
jgi:hypothetical protein